jgi:hypothetical protein
MSGLKLFQENYALDGTYSLIAGTQNLQFPLSNLLNESPSYKFRSTGNTATIQIDLTQTRDIDTFMLVGDNITGLNLTSVVFKTSVNTDFSGSTPHSVTLDSYNNFGYVFITAVSHRYVRIELTGSGSFSQLSNIFIGKGIELTNNNLSLRGFSYTHKDNSTVVKNRYGQRFVDRLNQQKLISGDIEFATKAEQNTLDDFFRYAGVNRPVWMIVDSAGVSLIDGETLLSIYGYLTDEPSWSPDGGYHYSTSLTIEEAI